MSKFSIFNFQFTVVPYTRKPEQFRSFSEGIWPDLLKADLEFLHAAHAGGVTAANVWPGCCPAAS
jgi:hypothetical protein